MASPISSFSSAQTEELRMKNYKTQLEKKNEIDLRDLQSRHADDVIRLSSTQTQQLEDLQNAYDIKISAEAEVLEEKLNQIRVSNEERVNQEKRLADQEIQKVKNNHQSELNHLKKKSEIQITDLHKQYQKTSAILHEQSKQTSKREREKTSL